MKDKTIPMVNSYTPIEMTGNFFAQGQVIINPENELQNKIYDLFIEYPHIKTICINTDRSGTIYQNPKIGLSVYNSKGMIK